MENERRRDSNRIKDRKRASRSEAVRTRTRQSESDKRVRRERAAEPNSRIKSERRADAERRSHLSKKKKRRKSNLILNVILFVAVVVFCVSAFQLFKIAKGYLDGRSEYDKIRDIAVTTDDSGEDGDDFSVDFDKLLEINADTIGWIRFDPEPSVINYPVVQGKDNETYLHKTFSDSENTLGAIFLNVKNSANFSDRNSIVYGHRMKDGSMFRHLQDYEDEKFWKENPYFYIYTPDGRKLSYHIYAAGVVTDSSEVYQTEFASDEEYEAFLEATKAAAQYDTGVEVGTEDKVVTLSTCTSASDEHRFVVCGVLESEDGK